MPVGAAYVGALNVRAASRAACVCSPEKVGDKASGTVPTFLDDDECGIGFFGVGSGATIFMNEVCGSCVVHAVHVKGNRRA